MAAANGEEAMETRLFTPLQFMVFATSFVNNVLITLRVHPPMDVPPTLLRKEVEPAHQNNFPVLPQKTIFTELLRLKFETRVEGSSQPVEPTVPPLSTRYWLYASGDSTAADFGQVGVGMFVCTTASAVLRSSVVPILAASGTRTPATRLKGADRKSNGKTTAATSCRSEEVRCSLDELDAVIATFDEEARQHRYSLSGVNNWTCPKSAGRSPSGVTWDCSALLTDSTDPADFATVTLRVARPRPHSVDQSNRNDSKVYGREPDLHSKNVRGNLELESATSVSFTHLYRAFC
ncbi:uncharacterized protein DEA37_0009400 [Paragonimus westermani]|uniref:Uncharacterized protein n=1 Tax=Paragonimus westermani TaxID=34504 RepID=A0A5J4NK35_9TREM|nr:uncharacterized protein DEA37_0009400 [Paragonimus westermani]